MGLEKIQNDIEKLSAAKFKIVACAESENRAETPQEKAMVEEIDGAIKGLQETPEKALTVVQNGFIGGGGVVRSVSTTSRRYKDMFTGPLNAGGFKDAHEFIRVIESGRYDPRLDILNSANETVPSQGAFSVPTEFASQWLDDSLPNEVVRNLCRVYPMTSDSKDIPGWDSSDMSSGAAQGGLTMEFLAEGSEATPQTPKMRSIKLNAKMAGIYVNASLELIQDGRDFATNLESALKNSIGYGIDRYCIAGSGAGCPLGVLNAGCKIQIEKESGQDADTVNYSNLKKMYARQLNPKNAVWLFNNNSIPELLEQSVSVGVNGAFVPLLNEKNGQFTIFGRPVYFHPAMPALGDEDDCAFVDFSFYALGLRKEIWLDMTDSHRWDYRERSYRVLMRFDGMPTLDDPITPENGDTLSPIITLAERA